jgi:hypothetical protein
MTNMTNEHEEVMLPINSGDIIADLVARLFADGHISEEEAEFLEHVGLVFQAAAEMEDEVFCDCETCPDCGEPECECECDCEECDCDCDCEA